LGILPRSLQQDASGAIWVHAVSVGETLAIAGLVRELQRHYPDRKIFLSSVTAAGREAAASKMPGVAGRFYLPLDWKWAIRRLLEQVRPSMLLIVETELWPNLLKTAREFGCQIILVNARVSDGSFPGYKMVRPFMRRVLGNLSRICTQTATDAERFLELGAPSDRVIVTGNLKFDGRPPEFGVLGNQIRKILGEENSGPVFVAGSTMRGEEPLVLQAWSEIRKKHPRALMVLAPRHPARFEEVAGLLQARQLNYIRRTDFQLNDEGSRRRLASSEILLLDTIGELAEIFGLADIVFVGGSLVPTGGHNVVEPAFWAKPIIFGPHMSNFRDVASLFLKAGAAIQVKDAQGLAEEALRLIAHPAEARLMGERARNVVDTQAGATQKTLKLMEEWLGAPQAAISPGPRVSR